MKRYGITNKAQLGDTGADWIIGPGKSKEQRRVDRKRARRQSKGVVSMEVDEYEEQLTSMHSGRLVVGQQVFALRERVRFSSGV